MSNVIMLEQDKYLIKFIDNKVYITNKNTGFIYNDQIKIKTILWENNKNIYKRDKNDNESYHDIYPNILKLLSEIIKNNNIKEFYQYVN